MSNNSTIDASHLLLESFRVAFFSVAEMSAIAACGDDEDCVQAAIEMIPPTVLVSAAVACPVSCGVCPRCDGEYAPE